MMLRELNGFDREGLQNRGHQGLVRGPLASIDAAGFYLSAELAQQQSRHAVARVRISKHSAMITMTVLSSTVEPGASGSATSSETRRRAIFVK